MIFLLALSTQLASTFTSLSALRTAGPWSFPESTRKQLAVNLLWLQAGERALTFPDLSSGSLAWSWGPDSGGRCEDFFFFFNIWFEFNMVSHITQADLRHTTGQDDLGLETPLPTPLEAEITGTPCHI